MGNCNCIGGPSAHETQYTHQQEEITQNQLVVQTHPVYSEQIEPALIQLNTINHVLGHMEPLFNTSEGQAPFESEEFKEIRHDALHLKIDSRDLRRNVQNRVDAVNSGRIPIEQMSNNTQHVQDLFRLRDYASQLAVLQRRYNNEIDRTASSVNQIPPFERTDSDVRNYGIPEFYARPSGR
ncbi:hypothetical protein [Pantoea stewartii]|uniref:hypothetical protein n=1 Tax=Pantoea stewartii TaxID=66269 RepID=UPI00345BBB64